MERRMVLRTVFSVPFTAALAGCSFPSSGDNTLNCEQVAADDSETSVVEMDVGNAQPQPHTLDVRFYDATSGRLYCESSVDVAADPEPRSRVVREFALATGRYGILVQLEDGRTAWTDWEVGTGPSTVHVAIEVEEFGVGGAALLN